MRWDWDPAKQALVQNGALYRNEFRTLPDPTRPLERPFTFFQPYRYAINRVPVYPSIGNHDTRETEECDDREQVMDNFYLRERLATEEAAGRASLGPGLFYRFRVADNVEFVCIDTSKEHFFRRGRLFEYPKHQEFLLRAFPPAAEGGIRWRIPFCHHPPFCATYE